MAGLIIFIMENQKIMGFIRSQTFYPNNRAKTSSISPPMSGMNL
jgi:hypothetical protein